MIARCTGIIAVTFAALGGCGGDDRSAGEKAAAESCHAMCDAQEEPEGCDPIVATKDCKKLCDFVVANLEAECRDEFSAYYDCMAELGFECSGDIPTQPSEPCEAASQRFEDCVGPVSCVGADEEGFCPSVDCPCPDGNTPVSGFSNESGECRCYDTTTCVDIC